MSQIHETIDVNVPVRVAYDQWTQFEEYPNFMDGIDAVYQIDDRHIEWHAAIATVPRTWRARIIEQVPDQRIAWIATDGAQNAGVVSFQRLDDQNVRITLRMQVEPDGAVENIGDALGLVRRRAAGDLENFKAFIEERRTPTGAWRGTVEPARA